MKCAIYGAGSLGTVLGAYMTKGGIPVELVNRNRAHVDALREKGAHITGTVDFSTPVTAITPEEMTAPYDVIFLMTKQLHNKEVVTFLKPLLAPDGVIVTFQNGIPEPGIAEIVGESHTIGCVVEWGATMDAPGECVLTSDPDSLSFHMGGMQGVSDAKLAEVRSLLEKMCPVAMEDNLLGARWSKLLINATFSGLGTVVGGVFGDVLSGSSLASPVTVMASVPCEVLLIPYERLLLSDGSPAHQQTLRNLVRTISDKYFSLSRRIDLLVMKSLRAKVAAYLLSEAARAHSLTFSIPFSRIQLADYLNCDRSALSRELSTMQKEGLIDTYRSSFKLLEPDALQQMVQ